MIEVRSLVKYYGSKKVLNNLSFKIKKGSITGILGPNACGKTSLIKCILGLTVATSGEIWIDGKITDGLGEFRRKIGYMPQTPNFPENLCIRELLDMLETLRGQAAPSRQTLMNHFKLEQIKDQPLEQLSGGTRQKVSAVIAFMFDAPIIILDEPTVGLDPLTAVHFKDLVLNRAQQGTTFIFVSHILPEIEKMASEMIFINDGHVVFSGTIPDLLKQSSAQELDRAIITLFDNRKEQL